MRGVKRGHQMSALGRDTVDLAQPHRVARVVAVAGAVDVVINGAAYTQVDKAEAEPARAEAVNAQSVGELAEICARRNLPLIHLSTDYVFDGTKDAPYTEEDATNPLNVYGRTKLLGEKLLRERQPKHIILRTSWVYSAHGTNFVKTMLRLGVERDEIRIVDDQWGAPTAAGDIADRCLDICERISAERSQSQMQWGTYHYAASGETTWRRFAEAIFEESRNWSGVRARIVPIATSEYPTAARRPLNSRFDCAKIERAFGIKARSWREQLAGVLAEIRAAQEARPA